MLKLIGKLVPFTFPVLENQTISNPDASVELCPTIMVWLSPSVMSRKAMSGELFK